MKPILPFTEFWSNDYWWGKVLTYRKRPYIFNPESWELHVPYFFYVRFFFSPFPIFKETTRFSQRHSYRARYSALMNLRKLFLTNSSSFDYNNPTTLKNVEVADSMLELQQELWQFKIGSLFNYTPSGHFTRFSELGGQARLYTINLQSTAYIHPVFRFNAEEIYTPRRHLQIIPESDKLYEDIDIEKEREKRRIKERRRKRLRLARDRNIFFKASLVPTGLLEILALDRERSTAYNYVTDLHGLGGDNSSRLLTLSAERPFFSTKVDYSTLYSLHSSINSFALPHTINALCAVRAYNNLKSFYSRRYSANKSSTHSWLKTFNNNNITNLWRVLVWRMFTRMRKSKLFNPLYSLLFKYKSFAWRFANLGDLPLFLLVFKWPLSYMQLFKKTWLLPTIYYCFQIMKIRRLFPTNIIARNVASLFILKQWHRLFFAWKLLYRTYNKKIVYRMCVRFNDVFLLNLMKFHTRTLWRFFYRHASRSMPILFYMSNNLSFVSPRGNRLKLIYYIGWRTQPDPMYGLDLTRINWKLPSAYLKGKIVWRSRQFCINNSFSITLRERNNDYRYTKFFKANNFFVKYYERVLLLLFSVNTYLRVDATLLVSSELNSSIDSDWYYVGEEGFPEYMINGAKPVESTYRPTPRAWTFSFDGLLFLNLTDLDTHFFINSDFSSTAFKTLRRKAAMCSRFLSLNISHYYLKLAVSPPSLFGTKTAYDLTLPVPNAQLSASSGWPSSGFGLLFEAKQDKVVALPSLKKDEVYLNNLVTLDAMLLKFFSGSNHEFFAFLSGDRNFEAFVDTRPLLGVLNQYTGYDPIEPNPYDDVFFDILSSNFLTSKSFSLNSDVVSFDGTAGVSSAFLEPLSPMNFSSYSLSDNFNVFDEISTSFFISQSFFISTALDRIDVSLGYFGSDQKTVKVLANMSFKRPSLVRFKKDWLPAKWKYAQVCKFLYNWY